MYHALFTFEKRDFSGILERMKALTIFIFAVILTFSIATPAGASLPDSLFDGGVDASLQDFDRLFSETVSGIWLERVIELFGLFALGAVLFFFTSGFSQKTIAAMDTDVLRNFSWGLLGVFLAPFGLVAIGLTFIGIPLALFLGAAWGMLLLSSLVFAALWVGRALNERLLPNKNIPQFWQLVIGGTLWVVTLDWLPDFFTGNVHAVVLGLTLLVKIFFVLWAAGAVLRVKQEAMRKGYV